MILTHHMNSFFADTIRFVSFWSDRPVIHSKVQPDQNMMKPELSRIHLNSSFEVSSYSGQMVIYEFQCVTRTILLKNSSGHVRINWMNFPIIRSGSWHSKLKFWEIFWRSFPGFANYLLAIRVNNSGLISESQNRNRANKVGCVFPNKLFEITIRSLGLL